MNGGYMESAIFIMKPFLRIYEECKEFPIVVRRFIC
jgi:hypothetical protein